MLINKYHQIRCAMFTYLLEVSSIFIGNVTKQGEEKGLHHITT